MARKSAVVVAEKAERWWEVLCVDKALVILVKSEDVFGFLLVELVGWCLDTVVTQMELGRLFFFLCSSHYWCSRMIL